MSQATATKKARAFAYLRVSSEGQAQTGFSHDGLSIDAQREGARDKAAQLGAEIVDEFSDPGKSAYTGLHRRTDFLEMLEELKRRNRNPATRVDYVIVWALSRWARNTVDHFQTSNVATTNQYQSMLTSENVKRGLRQKASQGGVIGTAPLGYVNAVETQPDGRRVTVVKADEHRRSFIAVAFELYATGEYSLSQLAGELERLGLRARPTKRWPESVPLGTSVVQRLLRNRFYCGDIVYKRGTPQEEVFAGRHEPLIDRATFDKVQLLLDDKRLSGERPQTEKHYLRGSVFCDECGRRLAYARSTSKSGRRYAYFFCMSRVNGKSCGQQMSIPAQLVEDAVIAYYGTHPISLTGKRIDRSKAAIERLAQTSDSAVQQIRDAKERLIRKLRSQQRRMLQLYSQEGDSVSPGAFREERARLEGEIAAAEASRDETLERMKLEHRDLAMALDLLDDVQAVYLASEEATRRSYNLAFFKKLRIRVILDEETGRLTASVVGGTLTEPYSVLLREDLADGVEAETDLFDSNMKSEHAGATETSGRSLVASACSYFELLAGGEGLEPPFQGPKPCVLPTRRPPKGRRPA
jgi:site-specific DNA recombinase